MKILISDTSRHWMVNNKSLCTLQFYSIRGLVINLKLLEIRFNNRCPILAILFVVTIKDYKLR
jgi:hypothetical protein